MKMNNSHKSSFQTRNLTEHETPGLESNQETEITEIRVRKANKKENGRSKDTRGLENEIRKLRWIEENIY